KEENHRFNKGLPVKKIWACFEMIRELESRFPETFSSEAGYFAGILFTPWTRPRDLLENVRAAGRLGEEWLLRVVGTRLQLFDGLPITELAGRDGLIAERFKSASDIAAVCQAHPDQREIPWRFADPCVEFLHSILIRLDPVPQQALFPKDDPLYLEIKSLRDMLPERLSADYMSLITAIIETVMKEGTGGGVSGIFRRIALKTREDLAKKRAGRRKQVAIPDNLQFDVSETADRNSIYRFHISSYQKELPCFRRIGNFSLWYSHRETGKKSDLFAHVLLTAMKRLESHPPSLENLEIWRETVMEILGRSGSACDFEWSVRWMDFLD
ncbi:MAG: hypothetical protein FJ088_11595, partial [Deltaproteobacteria bacterium]|nr:hypothetical protein [Deltaproteobacteria bacterium]